MAYCIDNAVYTFGSNLQAELDSISGKNKDEIKRKRQRVIDKWLDQPVKFRNPGAGPTRQS